MRKSQKTLENNRTTIEKHQKNTRKAIENQRTTQKTIENLRKPYNNTSELQENIRKPEKAKINDEFAKNMGAKDLNELKSLIKKQITSQYKMNLDSISKEEILEQIEKIHEVDIPENLIQQEVSLITKGLKEEDIEKFFKFQGVNNLTEFLNENPSICDFIYSKIKELF